MTCICICGCIVTPSPTHSSGQWQFNNHLDFSMGHFPEEFVTDRLLRHKHKEISQQFTTNRNGFKRINI